MTIDIRPMLSSLNQVTCSRRDLLIQKSLWEQQLIEARKHLNAWELESNRWHNESRAYMHRIKELWLNGTWDDEYYKRLCELSYEASRRTGGLRAEVSSLIESIDWINTKLGL